MSLAESARGFDRAARPRLSPGLLGSVTLIVDVEQRVLHQLGLNVTLADDRAMSQRNSPFRSIGTLTGYLGRVGYTIDYVAGSSIGAWVGAWIACGMDANAIERTFRASFAPEAVDVLFEMGGQRATNLIVRLARETTNERLFRN
jgi:Patatin-like phospholipase